MMNALNPRAEWIDAEFGPGSCAFTWLATATAAARYDAETAHLFLRAARGEGGENWPERRLAVLLLENQFLRLEPSESAEMAALFPPITVHEAPAVLRKLARLQRAHDALQNPGPHGAGWRYFFRVARDVSKLSLARHVFSPAEVAAEIRRHLSISRGGAMWRRPHATPAAIGAPEYEAAILEELCSSREIYWVSERCGSELNALVEFPLTSAVVVVKPPGSDYEIEFKRAGTRRRRLLEVITERDGREAPLSHRLFGGSLGWLGVREGTAAALFSEIYRLAHGADAPCSRTLMNSAIVTVPSAEGETHILDYLTDAEDRIREAMRVCVAEFPSDTGIARASYEGERGATLQFLGQALPQQAVIFGSSSFRLDRIALYLSDTGPEHYFREGLGRDYTLADARWLADSTLEEILGEVEIADATYEHYAQYVAAQFAAPANRRRADLAYTSVIRQLGECWGTLLAVRGFSDGESFVQRNVGLKSVWRDGAWQVRIIFMDHDDLTMAGSRYRYLWPTRELSGMERDQVHVLGGSFGDDPIPGDAGALEVIYRAGAELRAFGRRELETSIIRAYRATQTQLDSNAALQALFYPEFVKRHRDFDALIRGFLEAGREGEETWKRESAEHLRAKGYDGELISESLAAIQRFRPYLERMAFLYGG